MALYLQTNVASMVSQNNLSRTSFALQKTFTSLSSGYRINGAADDAAGLGLAKSREAQLRSYAVAERNANDAISMAQTADGAAEEVHAILIRMRELAVQASNGTLVTADLTNLDTEFQAQLDEIDRIANVTDFNNTNLLAGAAASISFQVGIGTSSSNQIAVTFNGMDATELAVDTLDVTSTTNAQAAITAIDAAIQELSTNREYLGAAINRFQSTIQNLQSVQSNAAESLSRLRDADVAAETARLARFQVLAQAGSSVLGQANAMPQLALSLLRG